MLVRVRLLAFNPKPHLSDTVPAPAVQPVISGLQAGHAQCAQDGVEQTCAEDERVAHGESDGDGDRVLSHAATQLHALDDEIRQPRAGVHRGHHDGGRDAVGRPTRGARLAAIGDTLDRSEVGDDASAHERREEERSGGQEGADDQRHLLMGVRVHAEGKQVDVVAGRRRQEAGAGHEDADEPRHRDDGPHAPLGHDLVVVQRPEDGDTVGRR